jgi:hypothetical protein
MHSTQKHTHFPNNFLQFSNTPQSLWFLETLLCFLDTFQLDLFKSWCKSKNICSNSTPSNCFTKEKNTHSNSISSYLHEYNLNTHSKSISSTHFMKTKTLAPTPLLSSIFSYHTQAMFILIVYSKSHTWKKARFLHMCDNAWKHKNIVYMIKFWGPTILVVPRVWFIVIFLCHVFVMHLTFHHLFPPKTKP